MSQQLTPINGGTIPAVQTTTTPAGLNVLSSQYIEVNNLQSRPTEWVPAGRPIYRRLPATAETYQVDFFNVVTESNILGNTFVDREIQSVGYVYIPYGASINGPVSMEVVETPDEKGIMIKAGEIVWKHGKIPVIPAIVNFTVLEVVSGKYEVAYELLYDDSPIASLYEVTDFSLAGLPLNITSSTDSVTGWRYPARNAFITTSERFWSNEDSFFPSYAQPQQAYIQWESTLAQAYKTVTLRCPPNTAHEGTATLYYVNGSDISETSNATISSDSSGQFFTFTVDEPNLQTGWNVTFSSPSVSIQTIEVSGVITRMEPQAAPSPRAALVMYPVGTLPPVVKNGEGEDVPATYCSLAIVDVDPNHFLQGIQDTRTIIHRDFSPVADWLTAPFDDDLIELYEEVSEYHPLWMAPTSCMKQEYLNLSTDQIVVEA